MNQAVRAAEALHRRGALPAAEAQYRQALRDHPGDPAALHGLGVVLAQTGDRPAAIPCLRAALALRPDFAAGWANLGHVLLESDQFAEAAAAYRQVLARAPPTAAAHLDLAVALQAADQDSSAAFTASLALNPGNATAQAGLARCHVLQNRHAEALEGFRRAAALEPSQPLHRWNAALSALALGDVAAGWRYYEARWELPGLDRPMPSPRWTGAEPLAGRTLLLWAEQGFGDTLQFIRYAAPLAARGAKLLLEAPDPLVRLLAGIAPTVRRGEALPPHDFNCPLLSLPLACGAAPNSPYLSPDPAEAASWRARLAGLPGRRIGLVWAGAARLGDAVGMRHDRHRSIPPGLLAPLLAVPGVSWVSLQKSSDYKMVMIHDWTAELTDFAATAALIAELDLVIAVDTAVAHLAGALGRPVWLLCQWNADWRWMPQTIESTWYPSMKIFRQPTQGDWLSVLQNLAAALQHDG
jgi:tetratricopeptide (TPR) repeat protein